MVGELGLGLEVEMEVWVLKIGFVNVIIKIKDRFCSSVWHSVYPTVVYSLLYWSARSTPHPDTSWLITRNWKTGVVITA